ncbi:DGQHR domain-containing protein DpdB [Rubinisphaera margarita]|uniref:DGQHR domain-containing protein DpdB n=1 Tax=Rubinisphaera margarita TaxID=2909586 RepID=UPI001EE8F71D|nr:DGQHR domain-containing protein DpdB [Rubinisphaera margarita]MCG6157722.1 DGQHR domain-containing protein [Rubinisphaera margarita]
MAKASTKAGVRRSRKKTANELLLRVPALEFNQGKDRRLYSFAVDGKELHKFCTISRVSRNDSEGLSGYQRPEVVSHIVQIREYLESENPLLPNAIVVAFDESVRFKPSSPNSENDKAISRTGVLEIPVKEGVLDALKPGWIVDGQQRAAALRDARVEGFPICVVGFIASGLEEQRQQFILVNATKPLPKGLIYELLPSTEGKLPIALQRRRYPALLSERLNFDDDSPMQGMIRTPTNGTGVIADNSILKMLENSLTDGVLYLYDDIEEQLDVLKTFWSAVKTVFPDAWGELPRKSRLMHGAGIVAMGFLMDTIADRHRRTKALTSKVFVNDLEPLRDICHWTEGYWEFGADNRLKWNELQNVPRHIQLLSNYLLIQYRELVWKA